VNIDIQATIDTKVAELTGLTIQDQAAGLSASIATAEHALMEVAAWKAALDNQSIEAAEPVEIAPGIFQTSPVAKINIDPKTFDGLIAALAAIPGVKRAGGRPKGSGKPSKEASFEYRIGNDPVIVDRGHGPEPLRTRVVKPTITSQAVVESYDIKKISLVNILTGEVVVAAGDCKAGHAGRPAKSK
jgi:hypothetical protein